MFVRLKTSKNTSGCAVQIVKSQRIGNKVQQSIVKHIGMAFNRQQEEEMMDLARSIRNALKACPACLPEEYEIPIDRSPQLSECQLQEQVVEGPGALLRGIFCDLGLQRIFGLSHSGAQATNALMSAIFSVLIRTKSEDWMKKNLGMGEDRETIYTILKAMPNNEQLRECLKDTAPSESSARPFIVIKDLGFHWLPEKNSWGNSSTAIVAIAILNGYVFWFDAVTSREQERKSSRLNIKTAPILELLNRFKKQFPDRDPIIVGDWGLFKRKHDQRKLFQALNKHGYKYILLSPNPIHPKDMDWRKVLKSSKFCYLKHKRNNNSDLGVYLIEDDDADHLVFFRSSQAANTGKASRESKIEEFKNGFVLIADLRLRFAHNHQKHCHDLILEAKLTSENSVGANAVCKDYYLVKPKTQEGNTNKTTSLEKGEKIHISEADCPSDSSGKVFKKKFTCSIEARHDKCWDGVECFKTNIPNPQNEREPVDGISVGDIYEFSRFLYVIERDFSKIPPPEYLIFNDSEHWEDWQIRAHLSLCCLAHDITRRIEHHLEVDRVPACSMEELFEAMASVQSLIYRENGTRRCFRFPCEMSNEASRICKALQIRHSLTPTEITSPKEYHQRVLLKPITEGNPPPHEQKNNRKRKAQSGIGSEGK